MHTQRIGDQSNIDLALNATTSKIANHNFIPSYRTPPSYEQATRSKFKDLQSRAIQIIIDEKPMEEIAFQDGLASFVKNITGAGTFTFLQQIWFIEKLYKYCVSDLCHDKIMIFNRQWKNNFLTKILNTSLLKKHIFKLNANKFDLYDIKAVDNNIKQQIAIMLLNEYNLGDLTNLIVAYTSLHIAKLLHQTSLTDSNQLVIFNKFKMKFSQSTRHNLNNPELINAFDKPLFELWNNLTQYIQQQKTLELNNEFYMSVFNDYFRKIETKFLQH